MAKPSKQKNQPASQRQLKVAEAIRGALSNIMLNEGFYGTSLQGISVTISEVRMSIDLKNAIVFVYPLAGKAPDDFIQTLDEMSPKFRYLVGKSVKLRNTPTIHFRRDESFEYAHKINSLLHEIDNK